jgi:hypothetical protein
MCAGFACAQTVAYWRFEEGTADTVASGLGSVLDSSGHNLNGTPQSGPAYRASVGADPVPATAASNHLSLDFNDPSRFVFVPDNPLFEQTNNLTVEAYINLHVPSAGSSMIVFRGDDRGGLDSYYLSINEGYLDFFIQDQTGVGTQLLAPYSLENQWAHVAGTLDDASGAMLLYINGQQVASTTTSVRPTSVLDSTAIPGIGIGNLQSLALFFPQDFNGLIDEVRISNVALDPSQFLNAVPEPSGLLLLAAGGLTLAARGPAIAGRRSFAAADNRSRVSP